MTQSTGSKRRQPQLVQLQVIQTFSPAEQPRLSFFLRLSTVTGCRRQELSRTSFQACRSGRLLLLISYPFSAVRALVVPARALPAPSILWFKLLRSPPPVR